MTRKRKLFWLSSIVLLLAGGAGGFCWYWQSTAIDRRVCELVYEAAEYPDTRTERILRKMKLDFLLHEKPKPRNRELVKKEITDIGPVATPELISLLNDENDEIRHRAAQSLCDVGDKRAVEPLKQVLLNDKNGDVRTWAAWTLGDIGDKEAVVPLIQALQNDEDKWVRSAAVDSLGKLGDKRAVDPFIQLLRNEKDGGRRMILVYFLGELRDKRAVEPLIQILENDDLPDVCGEAVESLGKLGDPRAIEPLKKAKHKVLIPEDELLDTIEKIRSTVRRSQLNTSPSTHTSSS